MMSMSVILLYVNQRVMEYGGSMVPLFIWIMSVLKILENSGEDGVAVDGTKRSTMKNCNVSHSKESGLAVGVGGLMTIDGKDTTIHHNCTDGKSWDYGLKTGDSSSSIHLASSLTIETISQNNGGGGNYGGRGTIKTMTNNTKEAKK